MAEKLAYRRAIVKVSGEYLLGKSGVIDPERLATMAGEIVAVHGLGAELGVVIGGGNIFRGRQAAEEHLRQITADHMGMLATQINGLALCDAVRNAGVPCVMVKDTSLEATAIAQQDLAAGKVCVFVGGTGLPFFTTDTTAVVRALQIEAQIVLKATDVDGVYSADPHKDAQAKKYDQLTFQQALDQRLEVMDAAAFALCMQYHLPIGVFRFIPGALAAVMQGRQNVGTLITS